MRAESDLAFLTTRTERPLYSAVLDTNADTAATLVICPPAVRPKRTTVYFL